jgi:hypothetical protein
MKRRIVSIFTRFPCAAHAQARRAQSARHASAASGMRPPGRKACGDDAGGPRRMSALAYLKSPSRRPSAINNRSSADCARSRAFRSCVYSPV